MRYREAGEPHTAAADELIAVKEILAADSEADALEALGGGRACRCAEPCCLPLSGTLLSVSGDCILVCPGGQRHLL